MGEFIWIFIIASGFICSRLCNQLAISKGLDCRSWKIAGFLLGPIAVIAASGMPDKRSRKLLTLLCQAGNISASEINSVITEEDESNDDSSFITHYNENSEKVWQLALASLPKNLEQTIAREFSHQKSTKIIMRNFDRKVVASFVAKNVLGAYSWYMKIYL